MDGSLCDELLEEVLRRLPRRLPFFASSTADVSLVSKRWLRLYRSTTSTLSLRLSPDNCTPHSLSSFLSHFPCLSSLSITIDGCDRVSSFPDQILLSVASSCPKLTHLCLQPKPVSHFPLLSLSTSCPHLTSLDIALTRPFRSHWLRFFHSLKNLNVSFFPVPNGFEPVDAACEGNFDGLKTMMLAMSNDLEELALVYCNLGPGLLTTLGQKFRNLRKLDLSFNRGVLADEEFISMLALCNFLTELKVRRCEESVELFVLNCPRLRQIHVEESKLSDVSRSWASNKLVELVLH
ncbi:hypothetical protein RHGRI_022844 [Rhododendron griersonianum]|uniref:F-box/LRR-repeat protein n=1 Tax=Rhododendron griersonianum TaxID=479676 RepID=A0AAV6J4M1_9ERIC|nr:hypothetical protein RHGRI_022844 [Rhododendron griersonianum]